VVHIFLKPLNFVYFDSCFEKYGAEEVGHGPDCIMGQILNFAHLTETVAP